MGKIRVVWICSFSNINVRSYLNLGYPWVVKCARYIIGANSCESVPDVAIWNTKAIEEFEKISDVELHVIFTHEKMKQKLQVFNHNGIHYYAVSIGDSSLISLIKKFLLKNSYKYNFTWDTIAQLTHRINPDIVHLMGAENPPYSLSINNLSRQVPIIAQLQTLLTDSCAQNGEINEVQLNCEVETLKRTDYIGTNSSYFAKVIHNKINKNAVIVNTRLIIAESTNLTPCEKLFDFVYFSNNLNKAVDLAIEAFAIAKKSHPSLTLDLIGGITDSEKKTLIKRLEELDIINAVRIEGKLPTHEDVVRQIRKSKFALLPLKIDLVSSTIREAIWNGLPVITTLTPGTPQLNEKRQSVLVSEPYDHDALAANMLKLKDNPQLAEQLRVNGFETVNELYGNNAGRANEWVRAYRACISNFHDGTPLPDEIVNNY